MSDAAYELLKYFLMAALIPGGGALGYFFMRYFEARRIATQAATEREQASRLAYQEREQERRMAAADAAGLRAQQAHDALISTLNKVVDTCQAERIEQAALSRMDRDSFVVLLEGRFSESNELLKELAISVSKLRGEWLDSIAESKFAPPVSEMKVKE